MLQHSYLFLLCLLVSRSALSCQIHGLSTASGTCTDRYHKQTYSGDKELAREQWDCEDGDHCMPFCGRWIAEDYLPCIPTRQVLGRDRNFEFGRFNDHTVLRKDQWVQQKVEAIFDRSENVKGYFYKNDDCRDALERYFCWLNFPRCDENTGESLPMCESVCKNYFRVCGYDHSLNQCSPSRTISDSSSQSSREETEADPYFYFPGQPFVKNDDKNLACTPSIKGSSHLWDIKLSLIAISLATVLVAIIFDED